MTSLFIDTTVGYSLGILDEKLKFIDFFSYGDKKVSKDFHFDIYSLLQRNEKEFSEITQFFIVSGPGSYTGIRLGQGFADLISSSSRKVYSFYRYQIPFFGGKKSGKWLCPAYKGEVFVYSWNGNKFSKELISTKEFDQGLPESWKSMSIFNEISQFNFDNQQSTIDLLKEESSKVFSEIINKDLKLEPYYFRTLDKEFTKGKQSLI